MLGDRDEAERYRRLADQRRRPCRRGGGMGGDVDARRADGDGRPRRAGAGAMTIRKPADSARSASRLLLIALVAAAAALAAGRAAHGPHPSLDGLEPLLAARRFDEVGTPDRRVSAGESR